MFQQLLYQLKIMQNYCRNENWVLNEQSVGINIYQNQNYQHKVLNHLVEPRFQGVNRLFVLAFEDDVQRTSNKRYYLPNVEIKDYDIMIDGKNFFDQPVKIIK